MGYQRAKWKSGLTYENECDQCHTIVQYKDDKLGFRPWFPNGFVYCPKCNKPLRHNENLAINAQPTSQVVNLNKMNQAFCPSCGNKFNDNDLFCPNCGHKRR